MTRKLLLLSSVFVTATLVWVIYTPDAAERKATEALNDFIKSEGRADACLRLKSSGPYSIKLTDEIFTTYEFVVTFESSGEERYFRVEERGWLFWTSYVVDHPCSRYVGSLR